MDKYSSDSGAEGVVVEHPLIPDGEYEVKYVGHETHRKFRGFGDKLVVKFEVISGIHSSTILQAFYNIEMQDVGFLARGGTRYLREMRRLFSGGRKSYPPGLLADRTILAAVGTVVIGKGKRLLDEDQRYSVVRELLHVVEEINN